MLEGNRIKKIILLLVPFILVIFLVSCCKNINGFSWQEFGLTKKQGKLLNRYIESIEKEREKSPHIIKCDVQEKHIALVGHGLLRELFENYTFIRLLFGYTLKNPDGNHPTFGFATIAIDNDGNIIDDLGNFSKEEFSLFLRNQEIKIKSIDDIRKVVKIYCILNQLACNENPTIQELAQNKWKIINAVVHYENNPLIKKREYYWLLETAENKTITTFEYHTGQY